MFSPVAGGLILLTSITFGLGTLEEQADQKQTVHSKDVYKNLFTGSEVRPSVTPPKFVLVPEFKAVWQTVRTVPVSGTEYVERTKCHLTMVAVDPTYDAKIRRHIPQDQIASSKIRVIALPPCHR